MTRFECFECGAVLAKDAPCPACGGSCETLPADVSPRWPANPAALGPDVIGTIHAYDHEPHPLMVLGSFAAGASKVETPSGYHLAEDVAQLRAHTADLLGVEVQA